MDALVGPTGTVGSIVHAVGVIALVMWAVLEVGWGVNPWRRALGTGVLVWQVIGLLG